MVERSISFGAHGGLIGTLCMPDGTQAKPGEVGQVLFNAGIVHRVGPHRINVRLARRLAARGIASIRFDVSGLGDSARTDSRLSFSEQAVVDLQAAMDALGHATGVARFSLLGFCSGGEHSFMAAQTDARVVGAVLYDAYSVPTPRSRLNYHWRRIRRPGSLATAPRWLARKARQLLGRALNTIGARATPESDDAITRRIASRADFLSRIEALHDRGVRLHVMYSAEGGNYNYTDQFRDFFGGRGPAAAVTCDFLATMDHTATDLARQEDFMRRIEEWTLDLSERCRRAPAP